jgi:hypothetical protein
MIFRIKRKPVRYWFAWRPVRTECGGWAWLEVVEVRRGYACGEGSWKRYALVNE